MTEEQKELVVNMSPGDFFRKYDRMKLKGQITEKQYNYLVDLRKEVKKDKELKEVRRDMRLLTPDELVEELVAKFGGIATDTKEDLLINE